MKVERLLNTSQWVSRSGLLLFAHLCVIQCCAQTRDETRAAWSLIMHDIARLEHGLEFEDLPHDQYSNLVTLATRWRTFVYRPTAEEIEKKQKELETSSRLFAEQEFIKEKFLSEMVGDFRGIIKAAGAGLHKKLVDAGSINPRSPATLVLVPLPCPSREVYSNVSTFIESACSIAQERQLNVVLVRSYYGERGKSVPFWDDEVRSLPRKYAKYLDSGVLKFADSFPRATTTPWGFLFRNGELILHNNIGKWASKPKFVLDEFTR